MCVLVADLLGRPPTLATLTFGLAWPVVRGEEGADVEEFSVIVPGRDTDELKFLSAKSRRKCSEQTMPSKDGSAAQEAAGFNSLYLMSEASVRPSVEIFHRVTAAD